MNKSEVSGHTFLQVPIQYETLFEHPQSESRSSVYNLKRYQLTLPLSTQYDSHAVKSLSEKTFR
jgi:hypothetical protein